MTKDTSMRLHRIYNIVLAISAVLAGISLIVGCLYIYYGIGEYSREIVGRVFLYIGAPVVVFIVLAVAGGVYELISPLKEKKTKPEKDLVNLRKKLLLKKDLKTCDKALSRGIGKYRVLRIVVFAVCAVTVFASAVVFLIYALNGDNFHSSEITDSVIKMTIVLTPCLVVSGGAAMASAFLTKMLLTREIELLKRIPDSKDEKGKAGTDGDDRDLVNIIRSVFIVAAAVALIIVGIYLGGYNDVLTKAINICTECIGLG